MAQTYQYCVNINMNSLQKMWWPGFKIHFLDESIVTLNRLVNNSAKFQQLITTYILDRLTLETCFEYQ